MGPYLPLLRVDIAHGFFADGRCRGLRFVPVGDTAWWLRATDAIVREDGGALALFGAAGCQDLEPAAVLAWQVHAADEDFAQYTDHPAQRPGELLYLDAAAAQPGAAGEGWQVPVDVRPLTWPLVVQVLDPVSRRMPPLALLRVPLAALPVPPVRYRVQLAARATVWKYCLHGDWPEPQLQVVDLAREAEFGEPEPGRLDNGAPLLAIRSSAPIALAQRSERRFQLRSRQRGGDKVLVKRLPVAAAQFLAREQIGGASRLVSEIHVHR